MWQSILLISGGAALGATARWGLGLWLNASFSAFAFGTLIANFLGCFIIGILTALFWQYPQISQASKLFLITGFLGSLTTFSSFSEEVVENLFNGKTLTGLSIMGAHLVGCLLLTAMGIWFVGLIKSV